MSKRGRWLIIGTCASGLTLASLAEAGPLTPPAGPVASTARFGPRIEISQETTPGDATSVFRITQSGSYYLGGNVIGEAGKHGIKIGVPNVSIDLMGHSLLGVPGSLDGINASSSINNLIIENGIVSGFGQTGVDLAFRSSHSGTRVEGVIARLNGIAGIALPSRSIASRCTAILNNGTGISVESGSLIESCVSTINAGAGFFATAEVVITRCVAESNTSSGIIVGDGSTISFCAATDNGPLGILTGFGCTVISCSASMNDASGILAQGGSSVLDCTANANGSDGIRVSSWCQVRRSTCSNNGFQGDGAGIHALFEGNRIEGNTVNANDRGIDVDAPDNVVIRNFAHENTVEFDVAAGSLLGTVITTNGAMNAHPNGAFNMDL